MNSASLGQHWLSLSGVNKICVICRQTSKHLICDFCKDDLALFDLSECQGNLLNKPDVRRGLDGANFDALLALGDYQWPISTLISGLKFSNRLLYGKALAELFTAHCLQDSANYPCCLIPVPLGNKRFATRKYNQSHELAKHIARLTNIELNHRTVVRVKNTQPQSELGRSKRLDNLKGAFAIDANFHCDHVAIVDDVITTGVTTRSIYNLLKHRYPELRIQVWCMGISLLS